MTSGVPEGVRGAPDWLPPLSAAFDEVEARFVTTFTRAGYQRIRTPVFEPTEVFVRGVGESTDIVEKEMYTFTDKGGRSLTLRPEGTAAVVRAALQHHLHKQGNLPIKLYYAGTFYRHERPQAGRQREFVQVGIEALGSTDPLLDAEVVALGWDALVAVGTPELLCRINSMGCRVCRPAYLERLGGYLDGVSERLCADCRRRRRTNPLRVFDCRQPGCEEALAGAPLVADHLCDACRDHHRQVLDALEVAGVPVEADPRLVRGLDYYTRTTFEYTSGVLGAQSAVGGGGRYDGLAEDLGGDPLPGIGLALGVDRTLLALQRGGVALEVPAPVVAYVAATPEVREVGFAIATALRREGIATAFAYDGRSLRAALRQADRSGAAVAVLVGPREAQAGTVTVRDLDSGAQQEVAVSKLADHLRGVAPRPTDPLHGGAR